MLISSCKKEEKRLSVTQKCRYSRFISSFSLFTACIVKNAL